MGCSPYSILIQSETGLDNGEGYRYSCSDANNLKVEIPISKYPEKGNFYSVSTSTSSSIIDNPDVYIAKSKQDNKLEVRSDLVESFSYGGVFNSVLEAVSSIDSFRNKEEGNAVVRDETGNAKFLLAYKKTLKPNDTGIVVYKSFCRFFDEDFKNIVYMSNECKGVEGKKLNRIEKIKNKIIPIVFAIIVLILGIYNIIPFIKTLIADWKNTKEQK